MLADIIEQGIREHPELSVGMTTEGIEVRSVGNTLTLHETALTEAFNLKAAIEYQLQNCNYMLVVSSLLFSTLTNIRLTSFQMKQQRKR